MKIQEKALSIGTCLQGQHTYTIEGVMGYGSFGITYKAYTVARSEVKLEGHLGQLTSKREEKVYVAIKEFFMSDYNSRDTQSGNIKGVTEDTIIAHYRHKFQTEAENLSRLRHPNIVNVVEVFQANDTVYYVMEFLEGGSLEQHINNYNALEENEALQLIAQVGSAVEYMHQNHMLHLDLKPGNVMLTSDNRAVLIDFGLSKQYSTDGNPESSTTIGGGTPGYSPIEQMSSRGFAPTLDIYALAATLFKCLTGQRPTEAALMLSEGFPEQALRATGVSERTIDALRAGMAPTPAHRPQSVAEFLKMLGIEHVIPGQPILLKPKDEKTPTMPPPAPTPDLTDGNMGGTIVPKDPTPTPFGSTEPTVRKHKRSKAVWIVVAVVLAIAIGVGVMLLVNNTQKDKDHEIEPEDIGYEVTDSIVTIRDDNSTNVWITYTYTGHVNSKTKLPEGEGVAIYADGSTYSGTFKDGFLNGQATISQKNGDTFEGIAVNNVASEGTYRQADGIYFVGTFDESGYPLEGIVYNSDGEKIQTIAPADTVAVSE